MDNAALIERLREIMRAAYMVHDLCGDPLIKDKAEFDRWHDRLMDLIGTTEKEVPETQWS
jgi:hypothetical protein